MLKSRGKNHLKTILMTNKTKKRLAVDLNLTAANKIHHI